MIFTTNTNLCIVRSRILSSFHHGNETYPEHKILRLSDAFMDVHGLKLSELNEPPLELIVNVYNIYGEYNVEDEIAVVKREAQEDGFAEGHEKGMEKGIEKHNQFVLDLLDQGLSTEEIKQRLTSKVNLP